MFIVTFLPFANGTNTFPLTGMPPPTNPATGSQPQQAPEVNSAQPILGSNMNAVAHFTVHNPQAPTLPARQPRTGATKMRPSKTSTTPRNLCALEWTTANPKGTCDQFSTYYDGLSAEGKEKWEKLSADAKAAGKTAN
ncbi:hypothetical protein HYPSUDRAFT_56943 [Hypholoma sublateritium FD-334 SS-4]|uniref:Uncharacterized protein n=1 Tax=Hypholoma sublateritium (strain FD-334 SS-4) TaxID=945553 RepID=A0A0D2NIL6_HYPSF|nr:hypothetical protein HYPSUDRAFT_56943 [Hypholoma sublateritium FD-334 SS-4]